MQKLKRRTTSSNQQVPSPTQSFGPSPSSSPCTLLPSSYQTGVAVPLSMSTKLGTWRTVLTTLWMVVSKPVHSWSCFFPYALLSSPESQPFHVNQHRIDLIDIYCPPLGKFRCNSNIKLHMFSQKIKIC